MKKILLSIILILIAAAGLYAYYSYAVKHISNEVSEIKHASIVVENKTLEFDYPVFKDWSVKVYDNRVEYKPKPILGMIPVFQHPSVIDIDAVDYFQAQAWPSTNKFGVGYSIGPSDGAPGNMYVQFENGFVFSQAFVGQDSADLGTVLKTIADSFHEVK